MNEKDILLSICIPTYNREDFLKISLCVLMPQINIDDPIEVIVSDNCSPDNTLSVINQYITHPRFKLIKRNENKGPIINGIDIIRYHAKGKYCWYLGDDDYIMPGGISKILSLLESNQDCDFFYIDIENHQLDKHKIQLKDTLSYIQNHVFINTIQYKN